MNNRYIFILSLLCVIFVTSCVQKQEKTETIYPSIIEVVGTDSIISANKIQEICWKSDIPSSSVYQWKNRLIIYDVLQNADSMRKQLADAYPNAAVKFYDAPFYIFDRKKCDNKVTANKWNHTIMTANLVEDETMQKEYMNYHATQAEKWPEIANGFCKADFQQLLIFRNDRQLMLIISIPEGESLDELNPRTTENNPRVDEWNAIMAKYQTGVEGTQPGESWVVFEPVR